MSSDANTLRSIFISLLIIVQLQSMDALVSPDHRRHHSYQGLNRKNADVHNALGVVELSNRRTRTILSVSRMDEGSDNIIKEISKIAAVGLLSVSMLFNFNHAALLKMNWQQSMVEASIHL